MLYLRVAGLLATIVRGKPSLTFGGCRRGSDRTPERQQVAMHRCVVFAVSLDLCVHNLINLIKGMFNSGSCLHSAGGGKLSSLQARFALQNISYEPAKLLHHLNSLRQVSTDKLPCIPCSTLQLLYSTWCHPSFSQLLGIATYLMTGDSFCEPCAGRMVH